MCIFQLFDSPPGLLCSLYWSCLHAYFQMHKNGIVAEYSGCTSYRVSLACNHCMRRCALCRKVLFTHSNHLEGGMALKIIIVQLHEKKETICKYLTVNIWKLNFGISRKLITNFVSIN